MTVLLVRHAVALARHRWAGDDRLRPLTPKGEHQAGALVDLLAGYPIERVYSSPAVRCIDTAGPVAEARGLAVTLHRSLAEGSGTAALELVDRDDHVLLCAHGDNLPELLLALAGHLDYVPRDPPFAKGATWILSRRHGKVRAATYLGPPA